MKVKQESGKTLFAPAMAHTHDLLVEIEENHVANLKNKLVKYFQSKKSNGGDCEIEYENGSRTAVLHFRRREGKSSSTIHPICVPE